MYNPLSPRDNFRLGKKLFIGFCVIYTLASLGKGCSSDAHSEPSKIENIIQQEDIKYEKIAPIPTIYNK